jgi:uncharacterized membrane protein YkvA (DUF1232 family)
LSLWPWDLLLGLVALYLLLILAFVLAGRREAARAIAGFVPDCAVMFGRLARDAETPRAPKVALIMLAAYLASPIDLVPDFIPVAGQLDDAILVVLALGWLVRSRGEQAIREAWPGPESPLRALLAAGGVRSPGEANLEP